jgi:hypothetical protein
MPAITHTPGMKENSINRVSRVLLRIEKYSGVVLGPTPDEAI